MGLRVKNGYIVAHLFDRAVPWWIGAAFMILCIASVFGMAAMIGHLVIGRFSSMRERTSAHILMLLLLSVMLACDRGPGAEEVTENLELLGTRPSPGDTLEVHLVNRLRQLLAAVKAADSAAMGTLITADFKATDARVDNDRKSFATRQWGEELTYWQVLAGSLSDRLAEEYRAFDASADSNSATVYASGVSHELWSAWRYRNAAWHAVSLAIVPLPAVQPSVAGKSPIDRAR